MNATLRFAAFVVATLVVGSQARALGIPAPAGTARAPSSTATPTPTPIATPAPVASSTSFHALWEGHNSDAVNWTAYAQQAVERYAPDLIKGSNDVESFCPQYSRLGTQDRVNFWVQLVAAMTKYESGWNPVSYFVESSMGADSVTGQQTASEGLMQLSYSDAKNYHSVVAAGVCDFDFTDDQKYSRTDIRRSIMDPKTNLTCGIGILNRQVQRDHLIAEGANAYWAVIKTNRSSNKISQIRAITKALAFCN